MSSAVPDIAPEEILREAPFAVLITEPGGTIRWANPAAERLVSLSSLVGRAVNEVGPLGAVAAKAATSGQPATLESVPIRDSAVTVSGSVRPRVADDGSVRDLVWTLAEVSGRERTALRAEARFAEILERTPDLVGVANERGEVLYVNRALRVLCLGGPDAPAPHHLGVLHTDDVSQMVKTEAFPTAIREGEWNGRVDFLNRAGVAFPTWSTIQAHEPDGGVRIFSVIARDLRPQLQFEAVFRDAPLGIAITDRRGLIVDANPQLEAMLGRAREDIVGQKVGTLSLDAEGTRTVRSIFERMRKGLDFFEHELCYRVVGGTEPSTPRWALIRYAAARDPNGRLERAMVMALDIDDRRQAQLELEANRRFLDSVIENIPDMVFVKEASELRFVRFNRAGEQLLGFDRTDLMGMNDADFFPPEQAEFFIAKDRAVLDSGEMLDILEEPIDTRNGPRWLHTKKIPLLGVDGEPAFLLGISSDITEEREAREQLRETNEELQRFVYAAAHDLREPLRMIRSFGDILDEESGPLLGEEPRGYLERIRDAAERMQYLLDDLLSYTHVGTQREPFTAVDLNALASLVLEHLQPRIAELDARVDVDELPTVQGDPAQLQILLQNLISNGLKFHRPDVPPHVTVRAQSSARGVRIEVEDRGIGFDPKYLPKIFEVFERLHGRHSAYKGTGIGLAICRKVVERHGGTITAVGRPGQGALFVVELPPKPVR